MQHLLFVLGNISVVYISWALANFFFSDVESWQRRLVGFSSYTVVILLLILVFGGLGALKAELVVGTSFVIATLLAFKLRGDWRSGPAADISHSDKPRVKRADLETIVALGLIAAFGGSLAVRAAFDGTNFGSDDLAYHATLVAHWLQDQRLSLAPFQYQSYYPHNAEALSLWFVLPFHTDAYASLAGLYWLGLSAAGVAGICRALGASPVTALLGCALLLSSVVIARQSFYFTGVDLAGTATGLCAIAIALTSVRTDLPVVHRPSICFAGLLAGFAAGSKVSFALLPILLLLFIVLKEARFDSRRNIATNAALFTICSWVTGSYWYLKNWIIAGNPLFPAEIGPFVGPFGAAEQFRTKFLYWLIAAPDELLQYSTTFIRWPNWGPGLLLLSLLGYFLVLVRRRAINSTQAQSDKALRNNVFTVALIGLVFIVTFPFLPFSGSTNNMNGSMVIERRFLLLPFSIGLALAVCMAEFTAKNPAFWRGFFILVAALSWISPFSPDSPLTAVPLLIAAVFVGGALLPGVPGSIRVLAIGRRCGPMPAAILVFLLLAAYYPVKQSKNDENIYAQPPQIVGWTPGNVWRSVEVIPDGARVTVFGPGTTRYYPLFGRNLQRVPVRTNGDGSAYRQIHELVADTSVDWLWWPLDGRETDPARVLTVVTRAGPPDLSQFIENLRSARVEYVLVTRGFNDSWPAQKGILDGSEAAEIVQLEDRAVIYRLRS